MGSLHVLSSLSRQLLMTSGSRMVYKLTNTPPPALHRLSAQGTAKSLQFASSISSLCRNCSLSPLFGVRLQRAAEPLRKFSVLVVSRAARLPKSMGGAVHGGRGSVWTEGAGVRMMSSGASKSESYRRRTGLIYVCAAGIFMLGMSYAGVPLYRMFCQATGLGGTISRGHDTSKVETMQAVPERLLTVRFNADVASSMRWNFKPQQTEVKVLPGETALAFYTAKNPTDKPIIGISTYNVVPFEAGQYFNKIQCFCFEEQRLNPHEQVDMPVFFYIDPDFAEDPKLEAVNTITLSYTFFEAKEGFEVPLPGFMTQAQ
ncbi:cytochrome c oxidase assembly protein ctaG-like [Babylonia areolata]|uniref:cytochrome c oxidase assembly protein ctaG-like n=1 Tax=Babylonia areolata TaxID=304850 RepID=UPI003FD0749A